jgi:hypothetical protein
MSTGSPQADRSRWVVPIVVALIAAVGAVLTALVPSLLDRDQEVSTTTEPTPAVSDLWPRTEQPTAGGSAPGTSSPIAYSGAGVLLTTGPAASVDLDSMRDGTGGDNAVDLINARTALITSNGAQLAPLDRTQTPALHICSSALAERGTDTIAAAQIDTGFSLCIRTSAGRTGAVTLTDANKRGEPPQLGAVWFSSIIWNTGSG